MAVAVEMLTGETVVLRFPRRLYGSASLVDLARAAVEHFDSPERLAAFRRDLDGFELHVVYRKGDDPRRMRYEFERKLKEMAR